MNPTSKERPTTQDNKIRKENEEWAKSYEVDNNTFGVIEEPRDKDEDCGCGG